MQLPKLDLTKKICDLNIPIANKSPEIISILPCVFGIDYNKSLITALTNPNIYFLITKFDYSILDLLLNKETLPEGKKFPNLFRKQDANGVKLSLLEVIQQLIKEQRIAPGFILSKGDSNILLCGDNEIVEKACEPNGFLFEHKCAFYKILLGEPSFDLRSALSADISAYYIATAYKEVLFNTFFTKGNECISTGALY